MKQSDFIDKIDYAESAQQIEDKVMATTKRVKNRFESESGVASSFEIEDVKSYVSEVLEELGRKENGH